MWFKIITFKINIYEALISRWEHRVVAWFSQGEGRFFIDLTDV